MKYISIILLTLMFSCSNPYFKKEVIICYDGQSPNNSYFPIDTNRTWEYRIEYEESYKNSLSEQKRNQLPNSMILKLGEAQSIFYDKSHTEIIAYPLELNGYQNNYHYLIECSKGPTLIEVSNPLEKRVLATFPLFENNKTDTTFWNGVRKFTHIHKGEKTFNTNKGEIETIRIEEQSLREGVIAPNRKTVRPDMVLWKYSVSYYAENIGLFLREIYDEQGELVATYILEPYKLKYNPSPISP